MSSSPIDRYVLEGRLVTMGPAGVIDDGAIYVDGGTIEFVQPSDAPAPDPKYDDAPRIRTGDTIYPGLIELHNHLSYNAMPLWDVPKKYTNNGQWRGSEGYTRNITKPTQVLGQTEGVLQALVRYVECRALLGGVTTSQGITLAAAGGIKKFYKGLVRNVEQPLDDRLPRAGTKIANPPTSGAADYLAKNLDPGRNACYLQHLSEGTDDTARGWFLRLRIDDDTWAVNDVLCGIHSAALEPEDFQVLGQRGASMVWSPLSNYLLYGQTADMAAAKAAGVNIALGSDWGPSGSKNLLGELKVAWLASKEQGDVFTPEELVAMVTVNPARAAKWHSLLGTIQPGLLADLVAINGQSDDPFEQLLNARETSVTLVVIDGVPRVGQKSLMRRFWTEDLDEVAAAERFFIGRSQRYVYLEHEDDLLNGLPLGQAIDGLSAAMQNLPDLANQVDNAVASAIAAGADGRFAGGVSDGDHLLRVLPDFEEDDEIEFAFGAEPYGFWVTEPIELPPITVAQDGHYLRDLMAAPNLPDFIKRDLPGLHGETVPIPDSVGFLETTDEPIAEELLTTTRELSAFLRTFGELTIDERRRILDQALVLLEGNYVHLPLKRSMHAVDPVQRLRLLRFRVDETPPVDMPPEIEFHTAVLEVFNSMRDLHTGYRLPRPFNSKVAWLPFLIEEIAEPGKIRPTHVLSKWVANEWPHRDMKGARVTHWNGMTIHNAIARNADRQAGSNPDARHARGLHSMTIRPLVKSLPPDEEWVTLRWLDENDEAHEYTQPWLVFEPGSPGRLDPGGLLVEASAIGLDDYTDDVHQARKVLYAGKVARAEAAARRQEVPEPTRDAEADRGSILPGVFRTRLVRRTDATDDDPSFGYVRIFTFHVRSADTFVAEFARLVGELGEHAGLIIDVRGNGGGLIYAAEQLLQVLSREEVEAERAQFINTPLNLRICRRHGVSTLIPGLGLQPWIESMKLAVRTGATFSLSFPITDKDRLRQTKQRYSNPTVLITDPLSYSATDMFAAGFQDHGIGKIIGVGGATGAGGANVWSHRLLTRLMEPTTDDPAPSPYRPLPGGADMRVAIRRTTRVKRNAGEILEDLGVRPDVEYNLTRRDVMEKNQDLIDTAIDVLTGRR